MLLRPSSECTRLLSCKSPDSSRDARNLREAAASQQSNYKCPHLQDIDNAVHSTDLLCASAVFSGVRPVQCTCNIYSHLLPGLVSVTQCTTCACCHRQKLENLVHVIRCDHDVTADVSYCLQCCTCTHGVGISSHCHSVVLSEMAANTFPVGNKLAHVNTAGDSNSPLTSRHSELSSIQEQHDNAADIFGCVQTGSVIMDVSEWQRQHIEQLDRQKLEVLVTQFLSENYCKGRLILVTFL